MKLYYSVTSPYARKVRLFVLESGLYEQVDEILVNPFEDNAALNSANPLGKIPTLVLDNGEALFDSPVICRYLNGLSNIRLIPETGGQQWQVLRWEAMADGLLDAAYNLVMERLRPEGEQSSSWKARWSADILRVLDDMEMKFQTFGAEISLVQISLGAAVGYLDFRLPELLYEGECPQIARCPQVLSWYEKFKTRSSMLTTKPQR